MEADYILDYNVISREREHSLFLLARIKAGRPAGLAERSPLNLSVVLDRSGSMTGDKLAYVKQAAQFLVQHLGGQDLFSLVTYDNVVKVELPPGPATYKDQIIAAIRRIVTGGSTNLSGGWLQGCQLVQSNGDPGKVNRVMLLTDGLANEGITDPDRLAATARQKRDQGVTTTTIGVGMDFNEDLLTRMAAEGGGAFYFIDNPDLAPHIFAEELQDLLSVVGQNLVITLTLTQHIDAVRQLNTYPAEISGSVFTYHLGDLYADEIKMLLLELHIPGLDELGRVEVARLRFDYDELAPDAVTHRTVEMPIVVNSVAEGELPPLEANPEVVKPALLLRAARAREEAVRRADEGDFQAASKILTGVADAIEHSSLQDEALQQEHDMLREEAVDMDLGPERYDAYSRKTSSTQAFMSSRGARFAMHRSDLRGRMKSSREAIERGGPPPTTLRWHPAGTLDLTGLDLVTIGRAPDNDITPDDSQVSSHHCVIRRAGEDLYLEDLGSTNGTFANGGLVTQPFQLSVGDVVTVGRVLLRFE